MRRTLLLIAATGLLLEAEQPAESARLWGDAGSLASTTMQPARPALCPLGELGMAAAFPCYDEGGFYRAAIQGVNQDGGLVLRDGPIFLSAPHKWMLNSNIAVEPDLNGGVFVVWQVVADSAGQDDVYAQHLDQSLQPQWDDGGVFLFRTNEEMVLPLMNYTRNSTGVLAADDDGLIVVKRASFDERSSFFGDVFSIYKFDQDGVLSGGWPENGVQLFKTPANAQFYHDAGRGMWCFARNGVGHGATNQLNLIRPDGTKRFEDPFIPIEGQQYGVDNFTPDNTGGFYLMIFEYDNGDAGVQRYDGQGQEVWNRQERWLTQEDMVHNCAIPIASENGSHLCCFYYDGDGGPSPINTRLYWIDPTGDAPRQLWGQPMFFRGTEVQPFFYTGEGDFLLNMMHYKYFAEEDGWRIDSAQANILSLMGNLLMEDGALPIEAQGIAVQRDWESFYAATEITTPDFMGNLVVGCFLQNGESDWNQPTQVYNMPQLGEATALQLLPDQSVRLIGVADVYPGPHQKYYSYQLLNSDGRSQLPITGRRFLDVEDWADVAASNGALLIAPHTGFSPNYLYSDLSIMDNQNVLHPEQPLHINQLNRGGQFYKLIGDSLGGGYVVFHMLDGSWLYDVVHVDRNCAWDGRSVRPFDQAIYGIEVDPDGNGEAYVTGRTQNGPFTLQRITADNTLAFDAPHNLNWNALRGAYPQRLVTSDLFLWMLLQPATHSLDSINVLMMSYDQQGNPMWDAPVAAFDPNAGMDHLIVNFGPELTMTASADGGAWILLREIHNTPPSYDIVRLQKISREGHRVAGGRGVAVPLMSRSYAPQLLSDGFGGVWLFMDVYACDPPKLRAFHFDSDGNLIDGTPNPDSTGVAVVSNICDGVYPGQYYPPWLYADGSVGIAFNYGTYSTPSVRVQRLDSNPEAVSKPEPLPPDGFQITSVYPSPSNERVTVKYRLQKADKIELKLLDLTGREVGSFLKGNQSAGEHLASLNTSGIPSGEYIIQLKGSKLAQQRVILEVK